MKTKYSLENTKKVASAFKLSEKDTELLIGAVQLDIKANMGSIAKEVNNKETANQNRYQNNLQKIAEKSRIIK
ncbi:capsid morphogenesis B protein [Staphylococcus pseudintermedius]|uniref:capsid morphogenesis B protein n=1 Tax=Staphylococcus pseudintermedius TaxID=283734 RepID=UPI001C1F7F6D|nr:capsid morphogenesis B protein [Staphylococcus pseudintermedius]